MGKLIRVDFGGAEAPIVDPADPGDRLLRIRNNLDKINKLTAELRRQSRKENDG